MARRCALAVWQTKEGHYEEREQEGQEEQEEQED